MTSTYLSSDFLLRKISGLEDLQGLMLSSCITILP